MNGKNVDQDRIDPEWPQSGEQDQAVSELVADVQGSMSPFGTFAFPLDSVSYEHPETEINR